jgi:hypothetical protein
VFGSLRTHRSLFAAMVCVLAVSVFGLSTLAKLSQYPSNSGRANYALKATKLSGERTQHASMIVPRVVPCVHPPDPPAEPSVETAVVALPVSVSLESIRSRPPPRSFHVA